MYNIYQSSRRKDIQYTVYAKPSKTIRLFDRDYTATIKQRKIGLWYISRVQILGVELPEDSAYIKKELYQLRSLLSKEFGVVFVQLGIINELCHFDNFSTKDDNFELSIKKQRISIQEKLMSEYGLQLSWRENMPQSNIVYDVHKTDQQLLSEMNSGCRERIKKAIKKDLGFRLARVDEYELFYDKRCQLSGQKGFHPISKKQYYDLIDYMKKNNNGSLFVATYENDIIAGSICIHDANRITYLYGFADRKYSNIGGHHFLKFKIFSRAREQGIAICDMMGAAPTGFPEHPLAGVSKFKESLGGTKIEVFGNYDIVLRPLLYAIMKYLYLRRTR